MNKSIKLVESACKGDPLYQIIQDELIEMYLMVKSRRPDKAHPQASEDEKSNLKRMELCALIQYVKASLEIVLHLSENELEDKDVPRKPRTGSISSSA
jgi:chromosome segregation ATPase